MKTYLNCTGDGRKRHQINMDLNYIISLISIVQFRDTCDVITDHSVITNDCENYFKGQSNEDRINKIKV
jgi:hypothetical protein